MSHLRYGQPGPAVDERSGCATLPVYPALGTGGEAFMLAGERWWDGMDWFKVGG